uniref:Uncharacterized protein n=1 Tax=Oryza brachyantha TaxID=4533 RepID=J3NAY8_ORYBR
MAPVMAAAMLLLLSSSLPLALADTAVLGRRGGGAMSMSKSGKKAGRYVVILDAGSTGTRLHVFRFDVKRLDLLDIGDHIEVFAKVGHQWTESITFDRSTK